MTAKATYHYAAFRINKDGQTVWFDGVVGLNVAILTQEHYLGLKKLIAEHYDVRESNLVITSLTRIDTVQFESPTVQTTEETQPT